MEKDLGVAVMSTTANHPPARHSSRLLVSVSNAAGRGRLEMQVFDTIAFDDHNANDLGRHKLSRTSLNEATLQSQERSKCAVSGEWSRVPGLALEKEDFQAYMASKMHRHQVEP